MRKRAKGLFGGKNKYSIADPGDGKVHLGAHVSGNKVIFSHYNTSVKAILPITGVVAQTGVKVMF